MAKSCYMPTKNAASGLQFAIRYLPCPKESSTISSKSFSRFWPGTLMINFPSHSLLPTQGTLLYYKYWSGLACLPVASYVNQPNGQVVVSSVKGQGSCLHLRLLPGRWSSHPTWTEIESMEPLAISQGGPPLLPGHVYHMPRSRPRT